MSNEIHQISEKRLGIIFRNVKMKEQSSQIKTSQIIIRMEMKNKVFQRNCHYNFCNQSTN